MTRELVSFVEKSDDSLFSINNLPYGVFYTDKSSPRIGTAIGSYVLDLALLEKEKLIVTHHEQPLFNQSSLNYFASLGPDCWSDVRRRVQTLLSVDNDELQGNHALLQRALIPLCDVQMALPFKIEGYTDFYAALHHASNVGKLFRSHENALLPNWRYLPVAYNGRASTVFPSGTDIMRPKGQIKLSPDAPPVYQPCRKLDFELELGVFIGGGNPDGRPISVHNARSHLFGCVLLNDWSARDIQAFEYQPLGPFLSKSFATSISTWVVPFDALSLVMKNLPEQNPRPVEYLYDSPRQLPDIKLLVEIQPAGSNIRTIVCETSSTELYWSLEQMIAHHTVNNCILKTGDLLGTGTISGPVKESWGSLLEITLDGKEPITLDDGNKRSFLLDGDKVIITGYWEYGSHKLGFGSLESTVLPAS
ncbi:fumarylacetoacetase [Legionella taurinensis]|uniref:fumarylacetoacetase n=1 Tax=Legionella taurinensis TaxID=70611 RepID=A0A3A5L6A1_9GAMM|nr:fumarylacetoacetase [Legionella taurinensis]PUT42707.1 fumarylacetoacetase [Legionella taurinensis]PUT46738.1 fumarylacetoacetase [Legionella taurinensis]PUT47385.1 fumarylacetoacetase [Legionella taurinensis]RJT48413.1 fumarylacetoacetase [Legionella taurinensis]